MESLIHARDLLDFKPKKGCYTLTNNRVGAARISACLDRFLVQISLIDGKILISSKIMPKLTSDHHPISLLLEEEENLGLSHFVSVLFGLRGMAYGKQCLKIGPSL